MQLNRWGGLDSINRFVIFGGQTINNTKTKKNRPAVMKIHVFRGPEVSGHFIKAASEIVKKSKGPAKFIFHEGPGGEEPMRIRWKPKIGRLKTQLGRVV